VSAVLIYFADFFYLNHWDSTCQRYSVGQVIQLTDSSNTYDITCTSDHILTSSKKAIVDAELAKGLTAARGAPLSTQC
jgi:hypothetical protein